MLYDAHVIPESIIFPPGCAEFLFTVDAEGRISLDRKLQHMIAHLNTDTGRDVTQKSGPQNSEPTPNKPKPGTMHTVWYSPDEVCTVIFFQFINKLLAMENLFMRAV